VEIPRNHRVLFVYIGDEQPCWGRQAYVRTGHYYVMPGILYLAATLRAAAERTGIGDVRCLFFNRAVHDLEHMVRAVAGAEPSLLGLSCFSWNLEDSARLAARLRELRPGLPVVAGGPEVSHDDPAEACRFLAGHPELTALAWGEAEPIIADLAAGLLCDGELGRIPNLVWRPDGRVEATPRAPAPGCLDFIPEIDPALVRVEHSPGAGLAVVYQTYRGCPHRCVYCSFHGGSAGIRRFDERRVERELGRILAARADLVHFADPVFELGNDRVKRLLRFWNEHNQGTGLFFYTGFVGLDDDLASLIERARAQCEVGVQALHADVLERIRRKLDLEHFFETARKVGQRRINWYVDLMFGLPGSNMPRFRETIDAVMDLGVPFFMLYPLTVIPRSELGRDIERFEVIRYGDLETHGAVRPLSGVVYRDIGLHRDFSLADLAEFEDVCIGLYYGFQRYPQAFRLLARYARSTAGRGHGLRPYDLFTAMGARLRARCEAIGYSFRNEWPLVEGTFRETFAELLQRMGGSPLEREGLAALVLLESAIDHLLRRADRQRAHAAAVAREPQRLEDLAASTGGEVVALRAPLRLHDLPYALDQILCLGDGRGRLDPHPTRLAVLAPWDDWKVEPMEVTPLERELLDELPALREMPLAGLGRRMARRAPGAPWRDALEGLVARGVVGVYEARQEEGS
jgi:radical SAM superfamily enzyme YgiQ (UPF0313 family)